MAIREIREMQPADYQAVRAIYLEGIATHNATFETEAPEWLVWDADHLPFGRLVAVDEQGRITGWTALTKVSSRCVYEGVAEISVYVAEQARGEGVGKHLLEQLVAISEQHGIWTLQAGILKENVASQKLHEGCGFRIVGVRERLGRMNGVWRDVVLMERRSSVVGQ